MVEAIFDFKDINQRMNRKPVIAAVESESIPVYVGIDPAMKGSDQTIIVRPGYFTVDDKAEYEKIKIAYRDARNLAERKLW